MNSYTWNITQLDCYPNAEGQTNLVFNVHWNVTASDGTYTANTYGVQPLIYVAGSPFIPFANLTQAEVIGWIQSAMGNEKITAIQTNLDNIILNLLNPPIVSPKLPWS